MGMRYKTGVYEIVCLKNKMRYIGGSCACILNRFSVHRFGLRRGMHSNPELQIAWNKFGEACFKFHILVLCEKEKVAETEQHYMDYWLSRDLLYNLQPIATSALGAHRTAAQRKKQSIAAKLRCDKAWREAVSKRVKAQHVAGKFGRKTWKEK